MTRPPSERAPKRLQTTERVTGSGMMHGRGMVGQSFRGPTFTVAPDAMVRLL